MGDDNNEVMKQFEEANDVPNNSQDVKEEKGWDQEDGLDIDLDDLGDLPGNQAPQFEEPASTQPQLNPSNVGIPQAHSQDVDWLAEAA